MHDYSPCSSSSPSYTYAPFFTRTMSINELLDLLRRLPPQNVTSNLDQIVRVLGGPSDEVADELLSSIDQPLKVLTDSSGREFLACDFNRDSVPEDDAEDEAVGVAADAYR